MAWQVSVLQWLVHAVGSFTFAFAAFIDSQETKARSVSPLPCTRGRGVLSGVGISDGWSWTKRDTILVS